MATLQSTQWLELNIPKKEVEEENGWRIEVGGSHASGRMYCPYNDPECRCGEFCITSIWSTPKNAGNHARQLKRVVDNCVVRKGTKTGDEQGGEEKRWNTILY